MNLLQTPANREIKALTSLRGFAAIAVVLQHFSTTIQTHSDGWVPSIVPHGYMAVDFFFILSGFIMSYTYLGSFQRLGMQAFSPFLLKRVARIFPLGIAITFVVMALAGITSFWGISPLFLNEGINRELAKGVLVNVMHLQGFIPNYSFNDPSWSVSMELGAYLLFPALVYIVFSGPKIVCATYLLGGVAILTVVALGEPRLGLGIRYIPFDLARCVAEFGFGMFAYRLYCAPGRLRILGTDRGTLAVTALTCILLILRVDLLTAFSFPLVVLAWAWNRGRASRIMSSPLPYYLGLISFSLYLVHHLFRKPELALVKYISPEHVSPVAAVLLAIVGSLSVIPFAALAYHLIEKPGRTAVNALIYRSRATEPVAIGHLPGSG